MSNHENQGTGYDSGAECNVVVPAAKLGRAGEPPTPEPLSTGFERVYAEIHGEPVAWQVKGIYWDEADGSWSKYTEEQWATLKDGEPRPERSENGHQQFQYRPLYAHPDPAVERLTRELDEARAKADENWKLAEYERHDANHWHIQFEAATNALKDLTGAFSIYTVEGEDGIRLSTGGKVVANYSEHSEGGIALLRLEAQHRAARAILGDQPT